MTLQFKYYIYKNSIASISAVCRIYQLVLLDFCCQSDVLLCEQVLSTERKQNETAVALMSIC